MNSGKQPAVAKLRGGSARSNGRRDRPVRAKLASQNKPRRLQRFERSKNLWSCQMELCGELVHGNWSAMFHPPANDLQSRLAGFHRVIERRWQRDFRFANGGRVYRSNEWQTFGRDEEFRNWDLSLRIWG